MDFPNKVVTVILVFLMLVVAPITWSYVRSDMVTERLILNESVSFIDKVTDKGSVTEQDLNELYIAINATGGTYDVKVTRHIRVATKDLNAVDPNTSIKTIYVDAELTNPDTGEAEDLNSGDVIKVHIKSVGDSPVKNLLWSVIKLDTASDDFALAGSVR